MLYVCHSCRFLTFPELLQSLFELADMWCPTTEVKDYVAILNELLDQCQVGVLGWVDVLCESEIACGPVQPSRRIP